ncbi:MAG: serine/threonine protein kinase [Planctomycetes bacterium]|nr:serine/threonine protein kinase [Planctomycetota bacterium]
MNGTLCPACEHEIPKHAPEGLCPRCLVSAGLVGSLGTQATQAPTDLLTVEELDDLLPHREVEALIGRGGMGAVYRARDPRLGRRLAIKVLSAELAADPAFVERFAREARAVARLEHPNIVQIHQFVEDADLPYLELEFVSGKSLRELLTSGPIRIARAREILRQVAAGLAYAHREGIVHRDVKPENVLVDEDGRVRLVDFGLAKIMSGGSPGSVTLTAPRQVLGTVHYMAPEQLEAPETVDARSDVYSWGVVAYEVLTGRLPLGRFGPPSRYAEVSAELDEIVLTSLEREPEDRYANAGEIRALLERSAGSSPLAAVAPVAFGAEPAARPSQREDWSGAMLFGVASALVCIGLLVLFVFFAMFWAAAPSPSPRSPTRQVPPPRASTDEPTPTLQQMEFLATLAKKTENARRELDTSETYRFGLGDFEAAYAQANSALAEVRDAAEALAALEASGWVQPREGGWGVELDTIERAARIVRVRITAEQPQYGRLARAREDLKVTALGEGGRSEQDAKWLRARAALSLTLGQLDEARLDYQEWGRKSGASAEQELGLGKVLSWQGQPKVALVHFEKAHELLDRRYGKSWSSASPRAWLLLERLVDVATGALLRLGADAPAKQGKLWAARGLAPYSGPPSGSLPRAKLSAGGGDLFAALDELQLAIKSGPKHRVGRVQLLAAQVFLGHGLLPEAKSALELVPPSSALRSKVLAGRILEEEFEVEQAAELLQAALAKAAPWEWKSEIRARRSLARLAFLKGDLGEALEEARRAFRRNAHDRQSALLLIRLEADERFEGQYLDAAERRCRKVLAGGPSPRASTLLAWVRLRKFSRDPARAQRSLGTLLREGRLPSPFALDLYLRTGIPSEPHAKRSRDRLWDFERAPSSPCGRAYGLGLGYERRFQALAERAGSSGTAAWRQARFAYRAALWDYPFHLRAHVGLARLERLAGRPRASELVYLRRAFELHPKSPYAATSAGLALSAAPQDSLLKTALAAAISMRGKQVDLLAAQAAGTSLFYPPSKMLVSHVDQVILKLEREAKSANHPDVLAAKVALLGRLADSFEGRDNALAKQISERRSKLIAQGARARLEALREAKARIDAATESAKRGRLAEALALSREACVASPDFAKAWSIFAVALRATGQLRLALEASVCAAWLDGSELPVFLSILKDAHGTSAPKKGIMTLPPLPAQPNLRRLVVLSRAASRSHAPSTGDQEELLGGLAELERLEPGRLVTSILAGYLGGSLGHAQWALTALHHVILVRPDLAPVSYMAAEIAANVEDPSERLFADTFAILQLRAAKDRGLIWEPGQRSFSRLRETRGWKWLKRPWVLGRSK